MLHAFLKMADLSHGNLIDEASVVAVGRQPRDVEAGQILLQSLDKAHEVVHSKDVILHEASQVSWGLQRTVEGMANYICAHGSEQIQSVVDKIRIVLRWWGKWSFPLLHDTWRGQRTGRAQHIHDTDLILAFSKVTASHGHETAAGLHGMPVGLIGCGNSTTLEWLHFYSLPRFRCVLKGWY